MNLWLHYIIIENYCECECECECEYDVQLDECGRNSNPAARAAHVEYFRLFYYCTNEMYLQTNTYSLSRRYERIQRTAVSRGGKSI